MDYYIDATKKRLGRLASDIAVILQGKKDPASRRNRVSGDRVFVSHVSALTVSGAKATDKLYYRHTGYMGHLKSRSFEQAFAKDPRWVLREAVRRMLPKNSLNQKRLLNMKFVDSK